MALDTTTLRWVIRELETFKQCDPYTGELYSGEPNETLDAAIEWFKQEGDIWTLLPD